MNIPGSIIILEIQNVIYFISTVQENIFKEIV